MQRDTVYLYVLDAFADWEPGHAIAHIVKPDWQRKPGRYRVRTVATTRAPVRSMGNMQIVPDLAIDELDPATCAMLMLPGADTWDREEHRTVLSTAARVIADGGWVAAICGATAAVARAGLLDERKHTSNAREYLTATGYRGAQHYVDEPAVADGRLITATGVKPVSYAVAIFEALELYSPAVLRAWRGLYETGKPEYFSALMTADRG